MKSAVSIPDDLFDRAERAANRLGYNRSQLYAKALEEFLAGRGDDPVTDRLNEVFESSEHDAEDPMNVRAGRTLIESGEWEW